MRAKTTQFGMGLLMSSALVSPVVADSADGWDFRVAPLYLWAKNISGSSQVGPSTAELDLDFQDNILENLDAAFAIHVEATKGKLTLYGEYNYASLDPSGEGAIGPVGLDVSITFDDVMWELGGFWEFAETGSTDWELLLAARYMDQDLDVRIDRLNGPELLPIPSKISGGDDWWQGVFGLRATTRLSERWTFIARGDYGYGDSDNSSLHANLTFDYRFKEWGSAFVGYRYLDTDFSNGERGRDAYAFDADQQGPVLGIMFHF